MIQKGEEGGKEAAALLLSAVREHVADTLEDIPSEYKIVARIYANVKGLAETCRRAGIIDRPSLMDDFARGFTQSKALFDFVDVGSGKERADNKLSGKLQPAVSRTF